MKFILFGLGSIGRRHAANLRLLRPSAAILTADPARHANYMDWYMNWREALNRNPDADAALICSPTECHLEQMEACVERRLHFFVEKPPCLPKQLPEYIALIERAAALGLRCAVGFNYRYHPVITCRCAELADGRRMNFYARDDLEARYGQRIGEVMAAHPLDIALWLFGKPRSVNLKTDGLRFSGGILHKHGFSTYDLRMTRGARQSTVRQGALILELAPDDGMYVDLLYDWLVHVEGGAHASRLPTLTDGAQVVELLKKCRTF